MKKLKVIKVDSEYMEFEGGIKLFSDHRQDCCESHWLDFEHISIDDFKDMEFDLSNDDFFKRVPDFGIELIPIKGHPVRIAGYGSNNGYYSSDLDLVLKGQDFSRKYDITDCQNISE